jgi:hypothetical protein
MRDEESQPRSGVISITVGAAHGIVGEAHRKRVKKSKSHDVA